MNAQNRVFIRYPQRVSAVTNSNPKSPSVPPLSFAFFFYRWLKIDLKTATSPWTQSIVPIRLQNLLSPKCETIWTGTNNSGHECPPELRKSNPTKLLPPQRQHLMQHTTIRISNRYQQPMHPNARHHSTNRFLIDPWRPLIHGHDWRVPCSVILPGRMQN